MHDVWLDITRREMAEDYFGAIAALERVLAEVPSDSEAVIRLGFDYWLAMVEADRLKVQVPSVAYAQRFRALLTEHQARLSVRPDFCWAYGLPLSLHHYYFAVDGRNVTELEGLITQGQRLLDQAATLHPVYARLREGKATQDELATVFGGRGVLARYYGVV